MPLSHSHNIVRTPSPSSQRRSARRLPTRLRDPDATEAPTGALLALREESQTEHSMDNKFWLRRMAARQWSTWPPHYNGDAAGQTQMSHETMEVGNQGNRADRTLQGHVDSTPQEHADSTQTDSATLCEIATQMADLATDAQQLQKDDRPRYLQLQHLQIVQEEPLDPPTQTEVPALSSPSTVVNSALIQREKRSQSPSCSVTQTDAGQNQEPGEAQTCTAHDRMPGHRHVHAQHCHDQRGRTRRREERPRFLHTQHLNIIQEEPLDPPTRKAVSAPSSPSTVVNSDLTQRESLSQSTSRGVPKTAAGKNHEPGETRTYMAHDRTPGHRHAHGHVCQGKRGRPWRIRQGCPRRRPFIPIARTSQLYSSSKYIRIRII